MTQEMNRMEIGSLPLTKNGGLKVELVPMPGEDNPWRTRAEYLKEQHRDTVRFYATILALIVSVISTASTAAVAILTINAMP